MKSANVMLKAKVNVCSCSGLGPHAGDPEEEAAPQPPGFLFFFFLAVPAMLRGILYIQFVHPLGLCPCISTSSLLILSLIVTITSPPHHHH